MNSNPTYSRVFRDNETREALEQAINKSISIFIATFPEGTLPPHKGDSIQYYGLWQRKKAVKGSFITPPSPGLLTQYTTQAAGLKKVTGRPGF